MGVANTTAFRELVAQMITALEDRGISVSPGSVAGVLQQRVATAAARLQVSQATALHYADPQRIAAAIAEAIGGCGEDVPATGDAPIGVDAMRLPRLIASLGQAGTYCRINDEDGTADRIFDLITELALALESPPDGGRVPCSRGVLLETAAVLSRVAAGIFEDGWAACRCGTTHGEEGLDEQVAALMAADVAAVDELLALA